MAISVGLDKEQFLRFFEDGSAERAFQKDLQLTRSLGIRSLPTCLVQYGEKASLLNGMADYESFVRIFDNLVL